MEGWLLSFIVASGSSLFWTELPTPLSTTICLTCSLVLLMRFSNYSLLTWISGLLAGVVWISSVGHWHQYWQLQVDDFNKTILIEGRIDSLFATNGRVNGVGREDQRFNVRVNSIDGESTLIAPYSFRLSWHKPDWILKQGQKVQLLIKVKPAYGLANEGGFHYQQWLFSQKIQATGYVKRSEFNHVLIPKTSVRQRLLDTILSYELNSGRWIAALSLGYRGLLEKNDWNMLQATGTSHLIAISGLHMAVVATISYFISLALLNLMIRHRLMGVGLPMHKFALVSSLVICLFYAYLAGFSIPTVRAWTMMLVIAGLMMLNQSWSKTQSLMLLICVVILLFPLSLYGVSLWLSFLAVMVILYSLWRFPVKSQRSYLGQKWLSAAQMQLVLSLFMLPLVVWQFSVLSVIAPLVNLIAVPIVTLLLVPICVIFSFVAMVEPSIAKYGFIVADKLIFYCIDGLSYASRISFSHTKLTTPPAYVFGCLFVFLMLVFLPKLPFPRYLNFMWLLPLFSSLFEQESDEWRVDVLDVGQGLSVLITQGRRAILYDTGPSFPSGFNTAEAVILPLLQRRGISQLDMLIISHNDNDHAGGVSTLMSAIEVKKVISSEGECVNGWHQQWQGLKFEALWPMAPMSADENEASCVIKVSTANHSVLLTGDIDRRVERKLVNHHRDNLRSKVITAPHHGSNSSSSTVFIKNVSPDYVVFSQGFLNRWKFPRVEVVERYEEQGVQMFSTSKSGQVSFIFRDSGMEVVRFRQDIYPFWYANNHQTIGY